MPASMNTLQLFQSAENLQSTEISTQELNVLQEAVLSKYEQGFKELNYDDFMRMLVSIERIGDYLSKTQKQQFYQFAVKFLTLGTTQTLLKPQFTQSQIRYSSSLLQTSSQILQRLDSEFYQQDNFSREIDSYIAAVVQGLKLPDFFDAMREDEIYDKEALKESQAKAKLFVPHAEKLWKIISVILTSLPRVPQDSMPDIILLIGEYTTRYPCSWSSAHIIQPISEIKERFSRSPSTPSTVIGEYLLQIISRTLKSNNSITRDGAAWCLRQVEYPSLILHPKIVQFCLSFIDNPEVKIKATGFLSISHVVRNVNASEFTPYQKELHAVLSSCVTSRDPQILTPSLPLMLLFLQACNKVNPITQQTIDTLFSTFLLGLTVTIPEICNAYVHNIPALLDLAGAHSIKHMAGLFSYLEGMLTIERVAAFDKVLLADLMAILKALVKNCWPRVPAYKHTVFQAAVSGVIGMGEKCDDSIVGIACEIIEMLRSCCEPGEFKEFEGLYEVIEKISPNVTKKLCLV